MKRIRHRTTSKRRDKPEPRYKPLPVKVRYFWSWVGKVWLRRDLVAPRRFPMWINPHAPKGHQNSGPAPNDY